MLLLIIDREWDDAQKFLKTAVDRQFLWAFFVVIVLVLCRTDRLPIAPKRPGHRLLAAPMLSRVTWALLRLLVHTHCVDAVLQDRLASRALQAGRVGPDLKVPRVQLAHRAAPGSKADPVWWALLESWVHRASMAYPELQAHRVSTKHVFLWFTIMCTILWRKCTVCTQSTRAFIKHLYTMINLVFIKCIISVVRRSLPCLYNCTDKKVE